MTFTPDIDLTFTTSHEFGITQVEGETEEGVSFVDIWIQREMITIDRATIIVRDTTSLESNARREGLTIERHTR